MEAHEWRGSAPPRGDQGTGTQGSLVGRRSQTVDVDRELRVTEHLGKPVSGLAPRETQTDKTTSEAQTVPPLPSAALRGMPYHVAELDSGRRRSLLPGLGVDLPVLHSDLPSLRSHLPGSRTDVPGTSAPLSGQHVPPPRGQARFLPRSQDRRWLEIVFSEHDARVQKDAVATHSTSSPQDRTSFGPARCAWRLPGRSACRTWTLSSCGTSWGDCRARFYIRFARASGWTGGWTWPRCKRSAGRFGAHSATIAPHKTTPALAPRAGQSGPLGARPAGLGNSRIRTAASASEPTKQDYSSGLVGPRDGQCSENIFSGLDAGGLLDAFEPPPAASLTSGRSLRPAASAAPRPLQPCLRPLLVSSPCVPRLFRVLPLSLVLLCQRAKFPPVSFNRTKFNRWNTRFQYGLCFSFFF